MALAIVRFDIPQKRIYFDVDAGVLTERTVQEIGSLIKQELKLAPYIDDDQMFSWSGLDEYETGTFTGIVLKMLNGWTLWTEDQGAKHRFKITQGLVITSPPGGDPLGTPTNVVWSVSEQSVSALLTAGGGSGGSGFSGSGRTLDKP